MRRKLVGLGATVLLLAGAAQTAQAQARGYIGFGAGAAIPMGDFKDTNKTGWLGQVIAGITGANGMLGGRIDGMYVSNSFKTTVTGASKTKLIGANADLVVTPGKSGAKARPYFLGGVGMFNVKSGGNGESHFAFNFGAGLKIQTGDRMSIFTEARWISIKGDGGTLSFLPISIGLRWGGI